MRLVQRAMQAVAGLDGKAVVAALEDQDAVLAQDMLVIGIGRQGIGDARAGWQVAFHDLDHRAGAGRRDGAALEAGFRIAPARLGVARQQHQALSTLRPKLGWAQDNWLGYVTGGAAATQVKFDVLHTDNDFSGYSKASKERFVMGWSIGFGGEYALDKNWSLRGDG